MVPALRGLGSTPRRASAPSNRPSTHGAQSAPARAPFGGSFSAVRGWTESKSGNQALGSGGGQQPCRDGVGGGGGSGRARAVSSRQAPFAPLSDCLTYPSASAGHPTVRSDRQVASIIIGGGCGWDQIRRPDAHFLYPFCTSMSSGRPGSENGDWTGGETPSSGSLSPTRVPLSSGLGLVTT
jgi:hypothetical protein